MNCVTRLTLLQGWALLPPVFVTFLASPVATAGMLLVALVAALAWEAIFALIRRRTVTVTGVTTALIVTVMLPGDAPLWQVGVAVSLGVILGELIFGGRGFGFVSAATVSLALALISFPDLTLLEPGLMLAVATLPGLALLLWVGFISGIVMGVTALVAAVLIGQGGDPVAVLVALAFSVTFLIADPVSAPVTGPGRWIYGALAGGLIALFSTGGVPTGPGIVFAALVASVFAPLIDHVVVLVHAAFRRRRAHG